jgi:hypothetical protein
MRLTTCRRTFFGSIRSISLAAESLTRRLYLPTSPQRLHEVLESAFGLVRALLERFEVLCVLGQRDPDGVIHHFGHRAVAGGSLQLQCAVDIRLEIDGHTTGVTHGASIVLRRHNVKPSNSALDQTVPPVTPVAVGQQARQSVPPVSASVSWLFS